MNPRTANPWRISLARDAHTSGDPVSAENYFQHAEHYFRLIAAPRSSSANNPNFQPRQEGATTSNSSRARKRRRRRRRCSAVHRAPFGTREPQPYIPPNAQPFVPRDTPQPYQPREPRDQRESRDQRDAQPQEARPQPRAPQPQPQPEPGNVDALPAFITGGAPQPAQPNGQNGYENGGQPDRFPLHRRRRRHRGPRDGAPQGGEGPNDAGGD